MNFFLQVAAIAAATVLATSAFAQSANEAHGHSPLVVVENEPAPRLFVDPPLPGPLARGAALIPYRVENLRILPVLGAGALDVSPRVGHLHVTVDGLPWRWGDFGDSETVVVVGMPPGEHTVLIELADPEHRILAGQTVTFTVPDPANAAGAERSPIYGVAVPPGYRDWRVISVAREEGTLNDLRAILGNEVAITAFRESKQPFPDGTIIARLAWDHVPLEESSEAFGSPQSFVAGPPKNGVQFMVKDSRKYASTGGWGFAHFEDGKPADEAVHNTCFSCHATAKARDFVFARYAP